jgi:hypothetical protein
LTDIIGAKSMHNTHSLVINGIYKHYKGLDYKVLYIARHSETLESLVVYQALYGEFEIWVRPLNLFLETLLINNTMRPRFEFIPAELQI